MEIMTARLPDNIARQENKMARLKNRVARKADGIPWLVFNFSGQADNLPRQRITMARLADNVARRADTNERLTRKDLARIYGAGLVTIALRKR